LDENTFLLQQQASRRAFERSFVDIPVTLISISRGTTNLYEARTADLSEGGMGLVTSAPLVPNQPVSIEFTIPLVNQLLKLTAIVKHQLAIEAGESDRYGLEFSQATVAQRNQIKRLAAYAC
jgi:c-di-GMP-binding flagellar brake protein YcgR